MTAIRDIMESLIGVPVTPLESSLIYAGEVILCIVVFDTVLGIFRLVARITHTL